MKKVLVILGQHRSGTSLLAGALRPFGAYAGADEVIEPDQYNEKGYFESRPITAINDMALHRLGLDWRAQAWDRVKDSEWWGHGFDDIVSRLIATIDRDVRHKEEAGFYVLKDPRISLLLPLYLRAFDCLGIRPCLVFSDRRDIEIVESLTRRNSMSISETMTMIRAHREAARKYGVGQNILWLSTFDCLLYRPENTIRFIRDRFRMHFCMTDHAESQMREFIDKGLRHHRQDRDVKVIATYFGERRRKPSGPEQTILFLRDLLDNERRVDSGRFHDTLLVVHDSELSFGQTNTIRDFLADIDGTPTRNGVLKVEVRPWNNGTGASFGSFAHAYAVHRDDYRWWFFTEDNVWQIRDGYYSSCVQQMEANPGLAFIGAYRWLSLAETERRHPRHCHGGCGCSHWKFLDAVVARYGSLPFTSEPKPPEGTVEYDRWYKGLEQAEIAFTNVFVQLGYQLGEIQMPGPVSAWHQIRC